MNIYDACMKAAEHIDNNPEEFDFSAIQLPTPHCGTPGCALGWLGYFITGKGRICGATCIVPELLGEKSDSSFYSRLDKLVKGWRYSPKLCAQALRAYAKKHHQPPAKPTLEPGFIKLRDRLNALEVA